MRVGSPPRGISGCSLTRRKELVLQRTMSELCAPAPAKASADNSPWVVFAAGVTVFADHVIAFARGVIAFAVLDRVPHPPARPPPPHRVASRRSIYGVTVFARRGRSLSTEQLHPSARSAGKRNLSL